MIGAGRRVRLQYKPGMRPRLIMTFKRYFLDRSVCGPSIPIPL
jgi:hypothetical protein